MAEYKSRRLFQLTASAHDGAPESFESMWAYSIRYPHAEYTTPGRYRIRITRMTAAEFVLMMGGNPSDVENDGAFTIQAHVEKWSDKGWIHCLDWLGNPMADFPEIEQDLNDMFQAFTTGRPSEKNWDIGLPPKPKPPSRPVPTTPNLKVVKGEKTEKPTSEKGSDPDFDWI